MPVVVCTLHPHPDRINELLDIYADLVPKVHDEEGCELFSLHSNKDKVVIIERWDSPEALQAHAKSPVMKEINTRLTADPDLLQARTQIEVLAPVPLGTESQGQLA